ncbi:MAG TPA: hypothetical protein VG897_19905 [Terriglobales bacterium]|nr:hypothetical protein [Terriglobales bacterium]
MAENLVRVFWVAAALGEIYLAGLMFRRKLHREYPVFFALVIAECLDSWLAMLFKSFSYKAYYIEYWTFSTVITVLGFAVLREVFFHIFRPYDSLRNFGRMLFRWSAAVLILIAAVMAVSAAPVTDAPITNFILTLDRSVRLMQCGLVIFMYLFARQLGLTERHRIFGISLGFGIFASVHLMTVTLTTLLPATTTTKASMYLINVPYQLAWLATVVVWTIYMYRPEPERRRATVLELPESWNYKLAEIDTENNASAFLPNVVDTVERVLTRRNTTAELPS